MSSLGGGTNRDAELLEQSRAALTAAAELARVRRMNQHAPAPRSAKDIARATDRLEIKALEARPRGPNLPPWLMRNERVYVTTQDLLHFVPAKKWREIFDNNRVEICQRSVREGIRPRDLFLRTLLVFFDQNVRPGVGLQGPKEDVAEILACHRATAYRTINRVAERGELKHFDRKRRYINLSRQLPYSSWFTGADGALHAFNRWKDADGKLHRFVDTHGVLYATPKAVTATRRLERDSRGRELAHGLWTELWRTLGPLLKALRVRLRIAPAPLLDATPYGVTAELVSTFAGQNDKNEFSTGPPGG